MTYTHPGHLLAGVPAFQMSEKYAGMPKFKVHPWYDRTSAQWDN